MCCRRSMLRRCLSRGVVAMLLAGCRYADLPDPYPVIWEGAHVEVAAPDDLPICGGTLSAMDDIMAALRRDMGYSPLANKTRYYYVRPNDIADLDLCRKDTAAGCFYRVPAPTIYSPSIPDPHELAHAVRGPELGTGERRRTPWFFDEGLVHSYGVFDLGWPRDFDLAHTLRTVDAVQLQGRLYEPAAHFMSFLEEQYGKPTVVEFVDDLPPSTDWDELRAIFEQHTGDSLYAALDGYAAYPRCSKFAQTSHPFECSQEPVAADESGTIRITSALDCENPDTIGPSTGTMWRTHVITLRESGSHRLTVSHADSGTAARIDITSCEDRCSTAFDFKAEGEVSRMFNLEPGDFVIRVSGASDSPAVVDIEIVPPSRFGFLWCATIHQVTYLDEFSRSVPWEDNPPWGCACIDHSTHNLLLAELDPVTEKLIIPNSADGWLLDARLAVWQWAWRECEDTPIPAAGQPESDNCSDASNEFYADLFYDNLVEQTGNPEPIYPIEISGYYAGCDYAGD